VVVSAVAIVVVSISEVVGLLAVVEVGIVVDVGVSW